MELWIIFSLLLILTSCWISSRSIEGFGPSRILATPRVRDLLIWIQPWAVFRLNPQQVAGWAKTMPVCASTDDVSLIRSAEKQCLQTGHVRDVVEIPQLRMATATLRPPARGIRDTVNPPRGFDQSAMLTSYWVWDYWNNSLWVTDAIWLGYWEAQVLACCLIAFW